MIITENGKQSVSVKIDARLKHERTVWSFCQNGYQSTGVQITLEQFDMLKNMVNDHRIVEFYENLRANNTEDK